MILYTNILYLINNTPVNTFLFATTAEPLSTGKYAFKHIINKYAYPNFYKDITFCKRRADEDTKIGMQDISIPGPQYKGMVAEYEITETGHANRCGIVHWSSSDIEHYSILNPEYCNIIFKKIVYIGQTELSEKLEHAEK